MALSTSMRQTNFSGSFGLESTGFIAGFAQQDYVARSTLTGGFVDVSETLPIFGGIAITTMIPGASGGPRSELGPLIKRAVQIQGAAPAANDLTGFCVFDQAHAMIASPDSAVPQSFDGMSAHFYPLGSGARVVLPISAGLAAALVGQVPTARVSWDFNAQQLCPLATAGSPVNISGATWANTNGGQATFTVASDMTARLAVGAPVLIASVNPSGYNGTWTILSINASTIVVSLPRATTPGAYVSGGTADEVATATVALPVRIIDTNVGNSIVPVYDSTTGQVNWRTGRSTAVVQI